MTVRAARQRRPDIHQPKHSRAKPIRQLIHSYFRSGSLALRAVEAALRPSAIRRYRLAGVLGQAFR